MSVQENIQAYEDSMQAVKNHCMCASFEDLGGAYRILYPDGMILDGVQAVYAQCGKKVALDRMFNAMERHWNESGV